MLENRSFDHVLGYRAQVPGLENSNGLTTELISFLEREGFPVRALNLSGIKPNSLNLKTQFPAHVGHSLADVGQQLSKQITYGQGSINSPKGFIDNFTPNAAHHPE